MKNKLIDVLYKITIGLFFLAVLISLGYIVLDEANPASFIGGIIFFLSLFGTVISPIIIFITLIDRIFFHRLNSSNFYKMLIINIIYIILALTIPDPFSGLNMI